MISVQPAQQRGGQGRGCGVAGVRGSRVEAGRWAGVEDAVFKKKAVTEFRTAYLFGVGGWIILLFFFPI